MTDVQDDLTILYLYRLRNATLWLEEPNSEDGVITLTAVGLRPESYDFVESLLVQMLGSKLLSVHTQPDTHARFWKVVK